MVKREIIEIDEDKCNGCGDCVPACPEGAIQIINGKARLVNESFCDGLGACIGECPRDAITIEEKETEPYDERAVIDRMIDQGEEVLEAHLEHLQEHGQRDLIREALEYLAGKEVDIDPEKYSPEEGDVKVDVEGLGCPSVQAMEIDRDTSEKVENVPSRLEQWPVQLKLVPTDAPYFDGKELVIAADCVPFAYGNFHNDFLADRSLIIGCPKLDDAEFYTDKLSEIFKQNEIRGVLVVHMEVPCCFGMNKIVNDALEKSGKNIEFDEVTIGINGEVK